MTFLVLFYILFGQDPCQRRNGRAPIKEMKEVLIKTAHQAKVIKGAQVWDFKDNFF